MPVLAVQAGLAIAGGAMQARSARRAGQAQAQAAAQAQGFHTQAREGFTPYQQAGEQNLNRLNALMGGDYSGFQNSPDYLAAQEEGMKALDSGAAARGALYSGGADADRIRFGSNLASQQLGQYRNALQGMAGMGMQATGAIADIYGRQAGTATGAGEAQANSRIQQGNAWGNALNQISGAVGGGMGGMGGGKKSMPSGGGFGSTGGIGAGLAGGTRYAQPVQPSNPFARWS